MNRFSALFVSSISACTFSTAAPTSLDEVNTASSSLPAAATAKPMAASSNSAPIAAVSGSGPSVNAAMDSAGSASLVSRAGSPAAAVSSSSAAPEILEVNVTNMPDRENGMPGLAINPTDSKNLVYIATKHNLMGPDGAFAADAWGCFVAYTTDAGRTWIPADLSYGEGSGCSVPSVRVDSKGTFYALFNMLGSANEDPLLGQLANLDKSNAGVARSTDGGRTWSEPVRIPLRIGGEPKLRVDLTTGKVYAVAGMQFLFPSGVTVSSDGGLTWSEARAMPNPAGCVDGYPLPGMQLCGFPGNQIAVHNGILATAVIHDSLDGVTFHVSRDDGVSWTVNSITDSAGKPVVPPPKPQMPSDPGGGVDPMPWLSADPSQPGRFAAMLLREKQTFEVYVTENAGATWTGPTVIDAAGAERPWMEFGSAGQLGVMWRTAAVDAYSSVSFDAGRTFSRPIRTNSMTQPASDSFAPGDDWSTIVLDDKFAYIAWPDGRSGGSIDGIFARVPLDLYLNP